MFKTEAIRLVEPGRVVLEERELEIGPRDVLVETTGASICDADLRAWRGQIMPEDLPSFEWIGHEGGGRVVKVGGAVTEFVVGDHVMCFGPNNSWARHFKAHEDRVIKTPAGLAEKHANLGEPTAVGLFAAAEAKVGLGDRVAVIGLNYQGLLAVQALKKSGASELVAIDYSDAHLQKAIDLGADSAINTESPESEIHLSQLQCGHAGRFDVVFHSCGYWNPRAADYFNLAIAICKDEGHFVSVPDMMGPASVDLHRFHHHAIQVTFPALMHHNPHFLKIWAPLSLRPVETEQVLLDPLITETFALDEIDDAIRLFDRDPDQVKIALSV
tara:strand:+ start:1566 stop:2552 length:987 start_codon:yes stop_codon:yes gene_type:complete